MSLSDKIHNLSQRARTRIVWALAGFSFAVVLAAWLAYVMPAHNEQWNVSEGDIPPDNWSSFSAIQRQFEQTSKEIVPALNNLSDAVRSLGSANASASSSTENASSTM